MSDKCWCKGHEYLLQLVFGVQAGGHQQAALRSPLGRWGLHRLPRRFASPPPTSAGSKGVKRLGAPRKPQCFFSFFPFFNQLSFAYALISTFSAHTQCVYKANSPAFARPLRCFLPVSRLQRSDFRRTHGGLPEVVPSLDREAGRRHDFDPIVLGVRLSDVRVDQSSQFFGASTAPCDWPTLKQHSYWIQCALRTRKIRYFTPYVVSLCRQRSGIWDSDIKFFLYFYLYFNFI